MLKIALVPGKRYALTLQLMLKKSKKRKSASTSRSPKVARDPQRSLAMAVDHPHSSHPPSAATLQHRTTDSFPAPYEMPYSLPEGSLHNAHMAINPMPQHYPHLPHPNFPETEQIWRGLEQSPGEVPVWISDQSLGGQSFSQHGMDAFIIPPEFIPTAPQIW
jgi:hypothetical protein